MDVRLEAIRRRKRLILLLTFLGIIAALIFLFRAVLAPFLIALFTAYLIDPLIERMATVTGRAGAIVIIYVVLLFCLYLAAIFTIPAFSRQIQQARSDLPKLRKAAETSAQLVVDWYVKTVGGEDKEAPAPEDEPADGVAPQASHYRIKMKGGGEFTGKVSDQSPTHVVLRYGEQFLVLDRNNIERMEPLERPDAKFDLMKLLRTNIDQLTVHVDSALGFAVRFAATVVKALYMTVLILMITAFLVIDRPRIVRFLHSVPPERNRETWRRLTGYIDRGLAGVIRGQLLICLVNGLLTWGGLQLLGVRYSVLLGFVAGTFSLVPIFGTILSTIPIVFIAWGTSGLRQAVLSLGWILLIHFLEANFLNPKIMGSASKIHPVVVVFALIAGEYAAGIAGALLAVPAASIIQSCFIFFVLDRQLEHDEGEPVLAGPAPSP